MDFYTRAQEINRKGWFVLNCFQIAGQWRVNLQKRTENGATLDIFSEYGDAETPVDALNVAFKNAGSRYPDVDKPGATRAAPKLLKHVQRFALTTSQEKQLAKALDANFLAVKRNGWARSRNRTDDP